MEQNKAAFLFLRFGLAFAFLYPPVAAIFNPLSWIGYFPPFLLGYVPDLVLLHAFGVTEIIVGLWILSGWRIFLPSVIAALYLLAIVVFNLNGFDVVFRDLSIFAMAMALALMSRNKLTTNL